ncbi:beta/gamma crystallin domain-containing protein [Rickettsiella grylli]|uniref:Calcium-dependent cell adhesion molecule N-terminal domain-containing protein n=1 Tax=Rickettsiella grylli TaxID=59196 RepID=A8PKL6_9COXI|nr:beta/gamma crystallin domain-containing protein [Rickettsiella grylli]EDP45700.1 hypothetical protein RICGR_0198 [Rickettsiella grylli]
MAFKPTTKITPDVNEIILFTEKNYTGNAYSAIIGDNIDLYKNFNPLNDQLYSVKVGSAAQVTLIRDDGFSGPTQETNKDVSSIALGGPGSGLSSFIVLQKEGKYVVRANFLDKTKEDRSIILKTSNFNPTGDGVTIPNPNPASGENPNLPRVFTILDESNTENLPATVGLYVRRNDGVYEDIGALISVYLADSKRNSNVKIVKIKKYADYNYGDLTFPSSGRLVNFIWNDDNDL